MFIYLLSVCFVFGLVFVLIVRSFIHSFDRLSLHSVSHSFQWWLELLWTNICMIHCTVSLNARLLLGVIRICIRIVSRQGPQNWGITTSLPQAYLCFRDFIQKSFLMVLFASMTVQTQR